MTKEEREVMEMALDALEDWNFTMRPRPDEDIITAMKKCLANDALEKKAENARELGLMPYYGGDYEPEQEPWPDEPVGHIVGGVQPSKQELVACPYCINSATLGAVYYDQNCVGCVKRIATPPQRPSRSDIKQLTRKQIDELAEDSCFLGNIYEIVAAIEAAHGIKGEA